MNERHARKNVKGYKMSGGIKAKKSTKYTGAIDKAGKKKGKKSY